VRTGDLKAGGGNGFTKGRRKGENIATMVILEKEGYKQQKDQRRGDWLKEAITKRRLGPEKTKYSLIVNRLLMPTGAWGGGGQHSLFTTGKVSGGTFQKKGNDVHESLRKTQSSKTKLTRRKLKERELLRRPR